MQTLFFFAAAGGLLVSLYQRLRRLQVERRRRFLRQVRVALDVPESEW